MPPERILALDLGITAAHATGWATVADGRVLSGRIVLERKKGESRATRWARFRDWLDRKIEDVGPFVLAVEMPPITKGGLQGRLSLLGLVVLAEELAGRWDLEFRLVAPATVKKSLTGHGHAGKDQVAAAVAERYPSQPTRGEDQVDALAILEWARTTTPAPKKRRRGRHGGRQKGLARCKKDGQQSLFG